MLRLEWYENLESDLARDGNLANTKNIEHIKLTRRKGNALAGVGTLQFERKGVRGIPVYLFNNKWNGTHRPGGRVLSKPVIIQLVNHKYPTAVI